ncbi:UNVERIFIED_CONTAM: hypothetical protein ABID98_005371 [Brevibacillus sp. OAP136]
MRGHPFFFIIFIPIKKERRTTAAKGFLQKTARSLYNASRSPRPPVGIVRAESSFLQKSPTDHHSQPLRFFTQSFLNFTLLVV